MKKGKLLNLEEKVIKDLGIESVKQDFKSVKAFMESILTEAATTKKRKASSDENVYHTIIESLTHVIWVATKDGETIYLNKAWANWTGRSVDESLEHGWTKSLHPDDLLDQVLKWKNAYKHGRRYHGECRFVHINGNITHCAYAGIPVKDDQGKVTNWIGINFDITARKNAEKELKNKVAELTILNKSLEKRDKELKEVKALLEELKQKCNS